MIIETATECHRCMKHFIATCRSFPGVRSVNATRYVSASFVQPSTLNRALALGLCDFLVYVPLWSMCHCDEKLTVVSKVKCVS